jgi:hypothetical protein
MKRKVRKKPKPARAVKVSSKKYEAIKASKPAFEAPKADPAAALVTAMAKTLGLPLEAGWREGVTFNLGLILRLGGLVDEFALSDDTEPAPVYRA